MSEDHVSRILRMLDEGKLSASEAESLLAAIRSTADEKKDPPAAETAAGAPPPPSDRQDTSEKTWEFRWGQRRQFPVDLSDLGRHISAALHRIDPQGVIREAQVGGRRWRERFREWTREWQTTGETAPVNPQGLPTRRRIQTDSVENPGAAALYVCNPAGGVTILAGSDHVTMEAHIEAWAENESLAEERIRGVVVRMDREVQSRNGEADETSTGGSAGADPLEVRCTVELPEDWKDGLVHLTFRTPAHTQVRVETQFGEVMIDGVLDGAEVQTTSGPVGIERVANGVQVETISGQVRVSSIGGPLRVASKSGDVDARELGAGASAVTVGGNIRLHRVEGGPIEARAVSGEVEIEGVGRTAPIDVALETVSGNARLTDATGTVSMKTVSGAIAGSGLTIDRLAVKTVSGDVVVGLIAPFSGPLNAETVSGSLRVEVPSSASFRYRLVTMSGRLACEHPAADAEETSTMMSGTVGTDGGTVNGQTLSGDITVALVRPDRETTGRSEDQGPAR